MSEMLSYYKECRLCPRACGADRTQGARGACHAGMLPKVAHSMLHMWEEPCLSGTRGSGTVFFSGCSLGCVYCQNKSISRTYVGAEADVDMLCELFLSIEARGAHNVNLVTAAHFAPHVASALSHAKEQGLSIPVVYNTSGYESLNTLRMLEGLVDVYLTDVRYKKQTTAAAYSAAPDYPTVARAALAEMVRQTGAARLNGEGMMENGTLVRILLLPHHLIEAKEILRDVYMTYGDSVYISLMSQYTPPRDIDPKFPELAHRVTPYEYASLVRYARELGVRQAFVQEGSAASESFIPDFSPENAKNPLEFS